MDKIKSFQVNHLNLMPGVYVSRVDEFSGTPITTFDLRVTAPNKEPVMDMPAIHTIEHLGATYLRNCPIKDEVVYFGPMGCRTGFYMILAGDQTSEDVLPLVKDLCDFVIGFEGDIPGATPRECGNYSEQSLPMAKYYMTKYKKDLEGNPQLVYPE